MSGSEPIFGKMVLSAGTMKSGTTWLFNVLLRHPQMKFTLEKEIHYFYDRLVRARSIDRFFHSRGRYLSIAARAERTRTKYLNRIRPGRETVKQTIARRTWIAKYLSEPVNDAWYARLFEGKPKGSYSCDFSNLHAQLRAEDWRWIAERCSTLKVLYTMRDPTERAWSHVKFHLERSDRLDDLQNFSTWDYRKFFMQRVNRAQLNYGAVIRNLRASLPEEDVKLLFYENIHDDRIGHLRDIETFLGLKPHEYPPETIEKRSASSQQIPMPDQFRDFFRPYADKVTRDLERLGVSVPDSWNGQGQS